MFGCGGVCAWRHDLEPVAIGMSFLFMSFAYSGAKGRKQASAENIEVREGLFFPRVDL